MPKISMYSNDMNYVQMLMKPLLSMWDNIALLVPASILAIGLTIINALYDLVRVEAVLVIGLVVLVFIDFITGVYKALRKRELVLSLGFRQTSIKIIEYTFAMVAFVVIANMADAEWIKKTSFVWLGFIEVKSVVENLTDKKGVINELYSHIKDAFTKRSSDSQ